ncbi:MBL fold metallo-hydrolase [Sneathia sp. DSM 16630]|nr:MBL fold metallo-hydrolase [Sneathia sp. DSM 16630]
MEIKRFISTVLDENIYLLSKKQDCLLIDPGGDNISEVVSYIKENKLNLLAILVTHGHFDHILSINELLDNFDVPIYIGKEDKEKLYDPSISLARIFNGTEYVINKDAKIVELNDNDNIFDDITVLHTPGHTSGSVCYYIESDKIIFTGDTLFKMAYGRVDFPTGDSYKMRDSLNRLLKLDSDIIVYPGHGDSTTIGEEYQNYYGSY